MTCMIFQKETFPHLDGMETINEPLLISVRLLRYFRMEYGDDAVVLIPITQILCHPIAENETYESTWQVLPKVGKEYLVSG